METEKRFGDLDDADPHAESEAPFTKSEIESQIKGGMDLCEHAYVQKSLSGIKVFLLTVSVVTLLSNFNDGLVVGLIAWGLATIWNRWIWNKAIGAYGKSVTENAKQAGMEPFDFLNAAHARRGRDLLASLFRKNR
jgi:hypothetical protein